MIGISNHQEYYTAHYFEEILPTDLKETSARWKETALAHPDSEAYREPTARLKGSIRNYFRALEQFQKSGKLETQRRHLAGLLDILGYPLKTDWITLGESAKSLRIPVLAQETKQSGAPALWVLEALPSGREDADIATSPLNLAPTTEQYAADPQNEDPQIIGTRPPKDLPWEDLISKHIFALEEPPRWLLLVSLGQLVLIDRLKWAERRFIAFDLRELFNRREDATLSTLCALLHRESTCPADGLPLHDGLSENSHKNAFSVSEDLKLAVVASVEDLANEAVWYFRNVRKEGIFNQPTQELEAQLTKGCLRYLYRLLFCFYLEARPELGYLPVKSEEYLKGYSLESLRDLEMVELDEHSADGYFFNESIATLFHLIFEGRQHTGSNLGMKDHESQSIHEDFTIAPLKSHLFDPKGTPYITKTRFRNKVLSKVIRRLSLGNQGTGKKRRLGRISYATLGINQLGAVYENLLSYSGFFAHEELLEVKPAKDEHNPLEHAYFVTAAQLEAYEDAERVYTKTQTGELALLRHEKGKFIYRLAGRARKKSASYYTPESLTQCLVKYALKERLGDKPEDDNYLKADDILDLTVCEMAVGSAAFLNEAVNQLADAYLHRKQKETGEIIPHDDYTQERQKVKMHLADNNVFGVDLNPTAVELAEISLWLNTIYEGAYVPWFGLQLANGNSLIGARRETYPTHLLLPRKGKGGSKARWPEEAPTSIFKDFTPHTSSVTPPVREADGVYHWLLGDPGMSKYEDKVIKSLAKPRLDQIKDWRNGFVAPFAEDETDELKSLSKAADTLFQRHYEATQKLRIETTDTVQVWGQPKPESTKRPTTTHEKDKKWATDIKHPYSPYSRLKLAMDYWCALWFWPIEQAELLPTRQQFLTEMGVLLGHIPGFEKKLQQGELDALMVEVSGQKISVQQNELELDETVVNVDQLCADSKRLSLVRSITDQRKFFHWELEFCDLFQERGGFDLILGNPPWVKVEWNEGDLLSERNPAFAIRKLSASQIAEARDEQLDQAQQRAAYFSEYVEFEGTQQFLNAAQNYNLLKGQQTNLYKCFLPRSWSLSSELGVSGFIHPEGVYDDPNAGQLRKEIYNRIRCHFHFVKVKKLFAEILHWNTYSINIYDQSKPTPDFITLANTFLPSTVELCYNHGGNGLPGGIKDNSDNWDVSGHRDRLLQVGMKELSLFARLYDEEDTPTLEARLPVLHTRQLISVLEKFAAHPRRLSDLKDEYRATVMWDETNAVKKDHTIRRTTEFPAKTQNFILTGPHFFVGNPLFKTANEGQGIRYHATILDLATLPDDYLPRTNYVPDCSPEEYYRRTPNVPWNEQKKVTEFYRYVARRALSQSGERTLIPTICPQQMGHIDGVLSVTFRENRDMIGFLAGNSSVPIDFWIKTTGKSDCRMDLAQQLPLLDCTQGLATRALALNCLTTHYAELWSESWEDDFQHEVWYSNDPRLDQNFWKHLTPAWQRNCALRSDYARRWALVELDVLVGRELKLTLAELQTIYRVQFPVMRQNEADTWYDQNGRIVFTSSKGLPGVGFARKEWDEIKGQPSATRTVIDTTLPTGPVERTIEYTAPFTRCNREDDYALVWKALDVEASKEV